MTSELKKLNFGDLLHLDPSIDPESYDFDAYLRRGTHHVTGYCTRCEDAGCHISPQDGNYRLTHISHASSTDDLFSATGTSHPVLRDWHQENILFIMESPSVDGWDLYKEVEYDGHHKRPAQYWYWIHEQQSPAKYPTHFARFEYGNLFKSIIFTFQLKNAYLTNLIKCGLNNSEGKFKGYRYYDKRAVNMCYDNFLSKEIQLTQPSVIFCIGSNVYNDLWYRYENESFPCVVMHLPHPASRNLTGDMIRHLYYSTILEGLFEANIVNLDEAKTKFGEFLTLSNRKND